MIEDAISVWAASGVGAPLWAAIAWNELVRSPLAWGVASGVAALLLLVPSNTSGTRRGGQFLGLLSIIFFGLGLGRVESLGSQLSFWALAALTVGAAGATISMRSAVYSAIWFAVSLLGTGGLLCLQHAQFLGVATVVVYAGAIVVTFLFVVMLAQPEGHDAYDRISWGPLAKPAVILTVALLLGTLLGSFGVVRAAQPPAASQTKTIAAGAKAVDVIDQRGHMARLGAVLFSRHLIAVEIGGSLLLAALVGAVAIVIQGRDEPARESEETTEASGNG